MESIGKVLIEMEEEVSITPEGEIERKANFNIRNVPYQDLPPFEEGKTYLLCNTRGEVILIEVGSIDDEKKIVIPRFFLWKIFFPKHTRLVCDVFPTTEEI